MTKDQSKNLVIVTGGVLIAGTLLKNHYQKQDSGVTGRVENKIELGRKVIPILILVVVMSIMADQIPNFAGPFALLVIVAYLATHMDLFNRFVKEG